MGREAAGPGFLFHPGFFRPSASAGGRGESSVPAAGPSRGPILRAPAGGTGPSPLPRRLAPELRRRPAAGPDEPSRRAEDPRPSPALAVGPARPDRRDERLWRHYFGRERAGPTRFAPPESPRMRDPEGGAAAGRR